MVSDRQIERINADHIKEIIEAVSRELGERPPTIGIVDVSGVGKSSTINRLFRTQLPTSDTVACTKEFRSVALSVEYTGKQPPPSTIALRVVDAPGLGEDYRKDTEYLKLYKDNLPKCDVVLWMMTARNRAIALDQEYLKKLVEFHDKIFLRINQVDIIEPIDWSDRYNVPSSAQVKNIDVIHELGRDMGFWQETFRFLDAAGKVLLAQQEAERLTTLGLNVARRQIKEHSADSEKLKLLISALDQIAKTAGGEKAEFAAQLAEYGDTLL